MFGMTAIAQPRHGNGRFAEQIRPEPPLSLVPPQNPWDHLDWIAPDQARAWIDGGFAPHEANAWARQAFGVKEAQEWSLFGARPETARAWVGLGFTPETARAWCADSMPAPDPLERHVRYVDDGLYGPIDPVTALHVPWSALWST